MKFNIDKCYVMHCGRNNPERNYELYGTKLRKTSSEKDLGVIINCDMKFKDQVAAAAKKANRTLGMIKRNFECMNKDMFEVLYSTLVRPHLEHAVAVWSPYQVGQKEKLERVQRRATKMVKELRSLEYNERLNKFNLMSTEDRRKRGDMITTFKIMKMKMDVGRDILERFDSTRTRGHNMKLKKIRSNRDYRKNFFTRRVCDEWNDRSQSDIDSTSVESFKKAYDLNKGLNCRGGTKSW